MKVYATLYAVGVVATAVENHQFFSVRACLLILL